MHELPYIDPSCIYWPHTDVDMPYPTRVRHYALCIMVHACYTHYIVAHILHDAGGMRGLTGTLTKPLALYRNLHVATCVYICT